MSDEGHETMQHELTELGVWLTQNTPRPLRRI
jgi:hypothetical protein